ncbi:MAG: YfhO family protein, partial [Aggregatilineales bacterium]
MTPLRRLLALWPAVVLLALALVFFHRLAFSGLILGRGDTFSYFYPYWAARNAALAAGRLPLWTPDLFMGVPLLANSQLGTFYPLNWPVSGLLPPDGVRLSVLFHVWWALLGAYVLARDVLGGGRGWRAHLPALAAAVVYGLGGYVGAHVEQINQLQGLAWLPWLFWLYRRALARPVWIIPLGMGLALQFLSGHTQTVFITALGLGVLILTPQPALRGNLTSTARSHSSSLHRWRRPPAYIYRRGLMHQTPTPPPHTARAPQGERRVWGEVLRAFLTLAAAGALALLLALPQLVPTMEMTSLSNRGGGLNPNQATAFSLNPLLIGRGLLPSYDALIFGEYVAYIGVIGLGLALAGALIPRTDPRSRARWAWLALALAGLLLALGEFNPLYWWLAGLPGFNLFRVPARWLALFALGTALLAAIGLERLLAGALPVRRVIAAAAAITAALAALSTLAAHSPQDVIGPASPTHLTWAVWAAALIVLLALLARGRRRWAGPLLAAGLVVELFLASGVLPFNTLVPPETYSAGRFTARQLQAFHQEQTPPARLLSITELLFDPGDRAALEARYARLGLSELAARLSLVNTKLQEVIAPNLPLVWNTPSVDGFDGGLLPTRYYTAFTSLLLPEGELRTLDGRLREALARKPCRGACIPDQRWLNLTNTRYLITDKVFDLWRNGVAYDTQFSVPLRTDEPLTLADLPPFEADALDVLASAVVSAPRAAFTDAAGDEHALALAEGYPVELDSFALYRLAAPAPLTPAALRVAAPGGLVVHALTLADTRTGDFLQLVPDARWQRVLSSDIKLYENKTALPRAFVVHQAVTVPDTEAGTEAALDLMRAPDFDPARTVVLAGDAPALSSPAGGSAATVEAYTAERVAVRVRASAPGYLLLADAWYPGWRAEVNGQPAPIYRADAMFRAVNVPAGESRVVFAYAPAWLPWAQIGGAATWIVAAAALWLRR